MTYEPELQEILDDPRASQWLKNIARAAMDRDPVDAVAAAEWLAAKYAAETERLADALHRRLDRLMGVPARDSD